MASKKIKMAVVKAELDLGEPPQELLDWAKDNINEDPDTRCKDLEEFRNMIFSSDECTPHRTDDAFLLRFLRGRKFKLHSAHRLFVNYYKFKEENRKYFKDVQLSHLLNMGHDDIVSVPPYRDQTGKRILLFRIGNWDPQKYSVDELFQATIVLLELGILEQRAQILGGTAIIDLENVSMNQIWYITPNLVSKAIQLIVTSFPIKTEAIHVVNHSWVTNVGYKIIKPLLDERIKQRIFFHGENFTSLHEYIDPNHLPEKYGGVHPDYDYNDWINYFRATEKIREELESLGYKDDVTIPASTIETKAE